MRHSRTNSRFARIFSWGLIKKLSLLSGNRIIVDLLTLDAPPWLTSHKFFWLYIILTQIQDSAMSQSYALFWRFYSMDRSLHHGLDPVSISPIVSGQFFQLQLLRQYYDRVQITGCAESRSHDFGLLCTHSHWSGCSVPCVSNVGLFFACLHWSGYVVSSSLAIEGYFALVHALCMVSWIGSLVWPQVDLGNLAWHKKIRRELSITWYSNEHDVDTNTNLCLCRIHWD